MSARVHLQSQSGDYWQAVNGGGAEVNASGPWPREWETFTLQAAAGEWADIRDGSAVVIRSAHGQNVATDASGRIVATSSIAHSEDARFTIVLAPDEPAQFGHFSCFSLRASNGKYLCAEDGGGGALAADRTQAGPWETFRALTHPEPADAVLTTSIRTASKVHFLQADGGGGAGLSAKGPWPAQWETFDIVAAGRAGRGFVNGAAVNVRTDSWHYLQADGGGGGKVSAAGPRPGEHETFTLVVPGRRPWLRAGSEFGLRAANGMFVEADRGGGGAVTATAPALTPGATFTATDVAEPDRIHVAAATGEVSTSSKAFSFVPPGLGSRLTSHPNTTLVVVFTAEARVAAPGSRLEARIVVDGRPVHPGIAVLTDSTGYRTVTYTGWLEVTPGYHTVSVEWRSTGGQVYMRNRSLILQLDL